MVSSFENCIETLKQGKAILLVDDAATQPLAYLVCSAANISTELVCLMVNHGRGVICAAVSERRIDELGLELLNSTQTSHTFDFTASVEARRGVSTGISAADRAQTLHTLANTSDAKLDLIMPGHIFPLRAKTGGVLIRSGIAEAAVDLTTLASLPQTAALCHCLDSNGNLLDNEGISKLKLQLDCPLITISEIIRHRLSTESIIDKVADAEMPTFCAGNFRAFCFVSRTDQAEHLALIKGEINLLGADGLQIPILVRVQAENRIGDLLGLNNLPGLQRIRGALKAIQTEGRGIFVYVRHPRKGVLREQAQGIILAKESNSSSAQELREHGIGAQILSSLGAHRITLLTNSGRDIHGLNAFNLEITGRKGFSSSAV